MNHIIINKEGNFKDETVSSIPSGHNIMIENHDKNVDLKKENINNIKPMLSGHSNNIMIPEGKKIKIRPSLHKKVPSNTFSAMANNKKNNLNKNNSSDSDTREILSEPDYSENYSDRDIEEELDDEPYSTEESRMDTKPIKGRRQEDENEEEENTNDGEDQEDDDEGDEGDEDDEDDETTVVSKKKTYEQIQQEKQQLLFHLERLQKQGYPPSKKYSMASSYEDMQFEYDRLKKQRDVEKSIKFSRKILMAVVSGVEFLNGKFDPFDIRLEGWSENIMENVTDYDEVFEELHEKYSDSVKMAPELKLLAMVAGSGFMFHLTNSLFKSASPKLSDILKQNPDIMKNISEAAVKNMGNQINQEFGTDDAIGNLMKTGINMKMNPPSTNKSFSMGPAPEFSTAPRNIQPRMNQPTGIDELLNELNSGNSMKDDISVSSNGSMNIKSSVKRTKMGKKGGIQLDLR